MHVSPNQSFSDYSSFDRLLQTRMKSRRGRKVRPKSKIVIAILEACRTPSVEHWIMIKARLGYETFWSHMSRLLSEGKMISITDQDTSKGSRARTYYTVTGEGLRYLEKLKSSSEQGPLPELTV
jgi:predicted transcriptional regulator